MDRLKGLATYSVLCNALKTTPTVLWTEPYRYSDLFRNNESLTTLNAVPGADIALINLLNNRCSSVSYSWLFSELTKSRNADIPILVSVNKPPLDRVVYPLLSAVFDHFGISMPCSDLLDSTDIVFNQLGLVFKEPASENTWNQYSSIITKQTFVIAFHIRLGGVIGGLKDPDLCDSSQVLEAIADSIKKLDSECKKILYVIMSDSNSFKKQISAHFSARHDLLISPVVPFHIDDASSSFCMAPPVDNILQDISVLRSANFVFTTKGAFARICAQSAGLPFGNIMNSQTIKECKRLLRAYY